MRPFCRSAFAEATTIVAAAIILGFVYTGITGKGFFRASPASPSPAAPNAIAFTYLTFEEARELHLGQRALFIDARHAQDFGAGRIRGAISVPLNDFDDTYPILSTLPKDRILVIYCDGQDCSSSAELAKRLYSSGFSNVKVFFGGWNEWLSRNQPIEP